MRSCRQGRTRTRLTSTASCMKTSIRSSSMSIRLKNRLFLPLALVSACLSVLHSGGEAMNVLEIEHVHRGRMYGSLDSEDVANRIGVHNKTGAIFISGTTRALNRTANHPWGDMDNEFSEGETEKVAGETDVFLAKLSSGGDLQWVRRFGTSGNDSLGDMAITSSAVFLCGRTGRSMDGSDRGDVFITKYSISGQPLWDRPFRLSSLGRDKCNAIVVHSDHDVYIGGFTTGTLFSVERTPRSAQPAGFEHTRLNEAFVAHLRERNTSDLRSSQERGISRHDVPMIGKELIVVRGRQRYGCGDASIDFLAVTEERLFYVTSVAYRGRVTAYLNDGDRESVASRHTIVISPNLDLPMLSVRFMRSINESGMNDTIHNTNRLDTPNMLHGHVGGFRVTGMHLSSNMKDYFIVGCDADADTAGVSAEPGTGWITVTVMKYSPSTNIPKWSKALVSGLVLPDLPHAQMHSPKIAVDFKSHLVHVHVYLPLSLPNSTTSALSTDANSGNESLSLSSFEGSEEGEDSPFIHSALFVLDEGTGNIIRVWNRWDDRHDLITHTTIDEKGSVMFAGKRNQNAWVGSFGNSDFVSVFNDSVITEGVQSDTDFQNLRGDEKNSPPVSKGNKTTLYMMGLIVCALIIIIACCVRKPRPNVMNNGGHAGGW